MPGKGFRNSEITDLRRPAKLWFFGPAELLSTKYLKLIVTERTCPDEDKNIGSLRNLFLKLIMIT